MCAPSMGNKQGQPRNDKKQTKVEKGTKAATRNSLNADASTTAIPEVSVDLDNTEAEENEEEEEQEEVVK